MASEDTEMFSKLLTPTDVNKRLAIPTKILPCFPGFSGTHAVEIHLMYGTRMWPVVCTVRKNGFKKPVFSGGLWRDFVVRNELNVGDRITMYKVQDEDGWYYPSHYRIEVEKPAAGDQVDESAVRSRRKVGKTHCRNLPDAPMEQEAGAIVELSDAACSSHTPCVGEVDLDLVLAQPNYLVK